MFYWPETAEGTDLVDFQVTQPFNTTYTDDETNILDLTNTTHTYLPDEIKPTGSTAVKARSDEKADPDLDDFDLDRIQADVKPKSTIRCGL